MVGSCLETATSSPSGNLEERGNDEAPRPLPRGGARGGFGDACAYRAALPPRRRI